jgi:alanyl-tRNA synthetase
LDRLAAQAEQVVPGETAFDLYATRGLPLEITRDVAGERGFTVDEEGFKVARDAHAQASGAGAFGAYETGGNLYGDLLSELLRDGRLDSQGVDYDPYSGAQLTAEIVALVQDGRSVGHSQRRTVGGSGDHSHTLLR